MSRLKKSLRAATLVRDQLSPTTDWTRMVAILAAEKKKAKMESKRLRAQQAVSQRALIGRRKQQTAKQTASSRRKTHQAAT